VIGYSFTADFKEMPHVRGKSIVLYIYYIFIIILSRYSDKSNLSNDIGI
jgi:hypothetical protein